MSFVSSTFVLFLITLFIVYYLIPRRFQWMLLLAASYVFYGFAGIGYLAYILATTVSTYVAGLRMQALQTVQDAWLAANKATLSRDERKQYKATIRSRQNRWLVACLLFNFGLLAILKYANFTIANVNALLGVFKTGQQLSFLHLALPLGISFYTFQTMGYIIDVYRGKYPPERNIAKLALFVSFFPQLIQGPISRYDDLAQTLYQPHAFDVHAASYGLQRILWGFFKKMVIADRIVAAVRTIISDPAVYDGTYVMIGMFFYAIQLYADFTGGIDITIGIAQVLGIRVRENFQRPFFSKNIVEYWRRWHISLGAWFKDYLFFPISVSKPMLKLSSRARALLGDSLGKRVPVYLATILVWLTTGIWHGASWNYVAWGLSNCLVILVSQELTPFYNWFHRTFKVSHLFAFRLFQVARMFWIMCSIRIFDCYKDVGTALRMYLSIFTRFNPRVLTDGSLLKLGLGPADYVLLIIGVALMIGVSLAQRSGSVRDQLAQKPLAVRYALNAGLVLAILVLGAYGIGYNATSFIYNQF